MDSLRFQAGYSCGLSQVKTQIFYNLTFRPAILEIENFKEFLANFLPCNANARHELKVVKESKGFSIFIRLLHG